MKTTFLNLIIVILLPLSGLVFAEDFSLKSNDDLFAMRDQMRTMDNESRDAYRTERQSRMMKMDQSERDTMFADMGASGKRNMDGMSQNKGSRKRDGSGGGRQNGKGRGGQSGDANQYRYDQDSSQGYGSGYGSRSASGSGGGRGRGRSY